MPVRPYPRWPLFNRSVVAAFECSLTSSNRVSHASHPRNECLIVRTSAPRDHSMIAWLGTIRSPTHC